MSTNSSVISAQWSGYITTIESAQFQGIAVRYGSTCEKLVTFSIDAVSSADIGRVREGAFFTWTLAEGYNNEIISALNFESAVFTEQELTESLTQADDFQKNIAWN